MVSVILMTVIFIKQKNHSDWEWFLLQNSSEDQSELVKGVTVICSDPIGNLCSQGHYIRVIGIFCETFKSH